MLKLVLDTNIIVSSCIGNGYSKRIADAILLQNAVFEICVSDILILEYQRVSNYKHILKKYPSYGQKMNEMFELLAIPATTFYPTETISILKDETDNRLLELATTANAHYLITGNHLDFNISEFNNTKIISPKDFWQLFLNGKL